MLMRKKMRTGRARSDGDFLYDEIKELLFLGFVEESSSYDQSVKVIKKTSSYKLNEKNAN